MIVPTATTVAGEEPETVDTETVPQRLARVRETKSLTLAGRHAVPFDEGRDLVLHRRKTLPFHPNGMRFTAFGGSGAGTGEVIEEAARRWVEGLGITG